MPIHVIGRDRPRHRSEILTGIAIFAAGLLFLLFVGLAATPVMEWDVDLGQLRYGGSRRYARAFPPGLRYRRGAAGRGLTVRVGDWSWWLGIASRRAGRPLRRLEARGRSGYAPRRAGSRAVPGRRLRAAPSNTA